MATGTRSRTIDGKYLVTNEDLNKILSGASMSGIINGTVSGAISGQLNTIKEAGIEMQQQIDKVSSSISWEELT